MALAGTALPGCEPRRWAPRSTAWWRTLLCELLWKANHGLLLLIWLVWRVYTKPRPISSLATAKRRLAVYKRVRWSNGGTTCRVTIQRAGLQLEVEANGQLIDYLRRNNGSFLAADGTPDARVLIEAAGELAAARSPDRLEVSAAPPGFRFRFFAPEEVVDICADPETGRYHLRYWRNAGIGNVLWLEFYWHLVQYLALCHRGKIVTHAAGIRYRGGGLLVLGPGGSGKSTLASFFSPCDVLNDDTVILDAATGPIQVFGSPYRSKVSRGGRNEAAPARALLFLHQADRTTIEPLSKAEAFACLLRNTFGVNCAAARALYAKHRQWQEREADLVLVAAREIPSFRLGFDLQFPSLRRCLDEALGSTA
jgi:hypothetical protein